MSVVVQHIAHCSCHRCGHYKVFNAGSEGVAISYLTARKWTHEEGRLYCPGCSKLREGARA